MAGAPPADLTAALQKMAAAGLGDSETNVFVRQISPLVADDAVRNLLAACGPLQVWTRPEADGVPKAFGFAHYRHPEGAMRAQRLLSAVQLADSALQVQVASKTQAKLTAYEAQVQLFLSRERAAGQPTEQYPFCRRDELDAAAKSTIDDILATITKSLAVGTGEGLRSENDLQKLEQQTRVQKRQREAEAETDRKRRRVVEDEKRRREKRDQTSSDRFRRAERHWLDEERQLRDKLKRVEEHIAFAREKRARLIEEEALDSSRTRRLIRSREARSQRVRERATDERLAAAAATAAAEAAAQAEAAASSPPPTVAPDSTPAILPIPAPTIALPTPVPTPVPTPIPLTPAIAPAASNPAISASSPSVPAPIPTPIRTPTPAPAPVVAPSPTPAPAPAAIPASPAASSLPASRPAFSLSLGGDTGSSNHGGGTTTATAVGFGLEADKKTKLTLLDRPSEADREKQREAAQAVVKQIPTNKEDLFAFPVDWALFDKAKLSESKVRPWIAMKMEEILGEEEPTLTGFILELLTTHSAPSVVLEQLTEVLDDEAEMFVIKLWRFLLYSVLMHAASAS
eukprot:TRINITY_DN3735_c0_g1_i1.p1 TRINITY_DN3735_c0_g1~~TRINITY_DN3735_c0_g1_i1.p1  ORF type:complete len:581 (+),score=101.38 TRINITY_DN3735_c0_g1_i1:29-1744(+)